MFNKIWAAAADSFSSLVLVQSQFPVRTDLASRFLSLCAASLAFFLLSDLTPSARWDVGLAAASQAAFWDKLQEVRLEKKDGRENVMDREIEREREALQLFKWPLSLCTCSLCTG